MQLNEVCPEIRTDLIHFKCQLVSAFTINVLVVLIKERYHLAPEALTLRLECAVTVSCNDLLLGCPDNRII